MANELVSVIVPIYNVEKYLNRCLDSIAKQTYSNLEVIMVNDGTKDSSRDIAEKYQQMDSRFVLYDKENGGLSSGRNFGMKHINGTYVCFIDSDDFMASDFVENLIKGFDEDTDIVIGDYVIYNAKNGKSYFHGPQYDPGVYSTTEDKKKLLMAMFKGVPVMSVWKNMYRADFLKEHNLEFVSERLVYAEDQLFHTEAYSIARQVKIIPDIVFYHLIIPGSLSQSYRKNYFEMHKELRSRITAILKKYYDNQFVNQYENMFTSGIGGDLFHMTKCGFSESMKNAEKILHDPVVVDIYNKKLPETGLRRYLILYRVGKTKSAFLVVCLSKLMQLCNPIYRLVQRKQEYTEQNG